MKTRVRTILFAPSKKGWERVMNQIARYPGNYDFVTEYGFVVHYRHPHDSERLRKMGQFVRSPSLPRTVALMRGMRRMPLEALRDSFQSFQGIKHALAESENGHTMVEILESYMGRLIEERTPKHPLILPGQAQFETIVSEPIVLLEEAPTEFKSASMMARVPMQNPDDCEAG